MRTTLTLDDEVLHQVRTLAERQGQSLGEVVTLLLRRALSAGIPLADDDGVPVFHARPGRPTIPLAAILEAEDEE